jgi:glycosyltransferase involved in cell wall biosynthesis
MLGLRPEQRLVLAVARLNRQKGLDILREAAAHLPGAAVVAVAGEGPERDRLGPPLRLLGAREDVADLLAAADVVVLPSRWEGSPLAAHEALLAGRPLVVTAVGGVPALVGDADPPPAVLVPPEDPAALATAISTLLEDPSEAEALAARARTRAAQWPDAERTVQAVLAVYGELLGRG